MNRLCRTLLASLLGMAVLALHAAEPPPVPQDATLYEALGALPGIERLMADLVPRLAGDPRLASFFKDTKLTRLRQLLVEQVCQVSGGPCAYSGDGMREVHKGLAIGPGDFNALVEVLQDAMDAQHLGFSTQRRLLALLAPMHRDVITR